LLKLADYKDASSVSGAAKAAIVLRTFDERSSAKLISLMSAAEARLLSQAVSDLGTVNSQVVEDLLDEFAGEVAATPAPAPVASSAPEIPTAPKESDGITGSWQAKTNLKV